MKNPLVGLITWNMASGNPDYKHHFARHIDRFFNEYYSPNGLSPESCQFICVQEFKHSDKKKGIARFADHGYPYCFYVTRRNYPAKLWFWRKPKKEGQAIFSSIPLEDNYSLAKKRIIKSKPRWLKEGGWERYAQGITGGFQLQTGTVGFWACHYHNTNSGGTGRKEKKMLVCEDWFSHLSFEGQGVSIQPDDAWVLAGDFNLRSTSYSPFKDNLAFKDRISTKISDWVDWQVSSLIKKEHLILPTQGEISDHDAIYVQYTWEENGQS